MVPLIVPTAVQQAVYLQVSMSDNQKELITGTSPASLVGTHLNLMIVVSGMTT